MDEIILVLQLLNLLGLFILFLTVIIAAVSVRNSIAEKIRELKRPVNPAEPEPEKPQPVPPVIPEQEKPHTECMRKEIVSPEPAKPSAFEVRTQEAMRKIVNWFCVGEEFRPKNVPAEFAAAVTWLIRAGVVVLLCGIGFFLKYSIDNNLVSPAVRVLMSLTFGIAMAAAGYWGAGKKYRAVSIGILDAGLVTLYLSLFASFRLYHLTDAMTTFGAMTAVTVAAMVLALRLSAPAVAIAGCAGGYLTPVMLSDNSGNLTAFFLWILIMTAGSMIVARLRNWKLLNIIAFVLSWILTAAGMAVHLRADNYVSALICLSIGFVMFAVIPVLYRNLAKSGITLIEVLIMLFNALFYTAAACLTAKEYAPEEFRIPAAAALFTALVYFCETMYFIRRREIDRLLCTVLLCVTVLALGLVFPLLFSGVWLAASWSVFALALMLIASKTGGRTLAVLSFCAFALTAAKIFVGFELFSGAQTYLGKLSDRFFTVGVYMISLACAGIAMHRYSAGKLQGSLPHDSASQISKLFLYSSGLIFFVYSSVEVFECMHEYFHGFRHGGLSVWWAVMAITLLVYGLTKRMKNLRLTGLVLFALCAVKVFFLDLHDSDQLYRVGAFVVLGLFMLAGAVLYIRFRDKFMRGG